MSVSWNLNDSIKSSVKYIALVLSKVIAFHHVH